MVKARGGMGAHPGGDGGTDLRAFRATLAREGA